MTEFTPAPVLARAAADRAEGFAQAAADIRAQIRPIAPASPIAPAIVTTTIPTTLRGCLPTRTSSPIPATHAQRARAEAMRAARRAGECAEAARLADRAERADNPRLSGIAWEAQETASFLAIVRR